MSIDVETTATDSSASPGTPPPNGATPVPATRPPADDAEDQARLATARAIVGILRRSVIDPRIVDLVLDADRARTPEGSARARVIVNGADALARLLAPPTPDAFADAFLRGDIEIEGDVMAAVETGQTADLRRLRPSDARRLLRWTLALRRGRVPAAPLRRVARLAGSRHSPSRDMAAVRFHYDVGNAFYGLWLDRRLTYSCAYFPDGTTAQGAASGLDAAQEAKLELICRKLRLSPGMRLLDIGCGWGSLVGLAAERHGTESVGVTLSERQADEANARFCAAEVDGLARALVLDYRDLAGLGPFDAVASVGMFEHVGQDNLATYFRAAHEALRPRRPVSQPRDRALGREPGPAPGGRRRRIDALPGALRLPRRGARTGRSRRRRRAGVGLRGRRRPVAPTPLRADAGRLGRPARGELGRGRHRRGRGGRQDVAPVHVRRAARLRAR